MSRVDVAPEDAANTLDRIVTSVIQRATKAFLHTPKAPHLERAVRRLYSDPNLLDPLIADLRRTSGESPNVMRILGSVGPVTVRPDLVEVLADRAKDDLSAVRLLGAIGPAAATPRVLAILSEMFDRLRPRDGYKNEGPDVCEALSGMGEAFIESEAFDRLWPAVFGKGGILYWHALLLGKLADRHPDAPKIAKIRAELADRITNPKKYGWPPEYPLTVLESFGRAAVDDTLLEAVVTAGQDGLERAPCWRQVIQVIGHIGEKAAGNPGAVDLLVASLKGDGRGDGAVALFELSRSIPEASKMRVGEALLTFLEGDSYNGTVTSRDDYVHPKVVGGRALAVLEFCRTSPEVTNRCLSLLSDRDPYGREGALRALCCSLPDGVYERVLREMARALCEDEKSHVRRAAAEAMAHHARTASQHPFLIDALLKAAGAVTVSPALNRWLYRRSDGPDLKTALAETRSSMRDPRLFEEIELMGKAGTRPKEDWQRDDWHERLKRLSSVPSEVRIAAIEALGAIGPAAARHPGVRAFLRERGGIGARGIDCSDDEAVALAVALHSLDLARPGELEVLFDQIYRHQHDGRSTLERMGLRHLPIDHSPWVISVGEPDFVRQPWAG
jgi:HEAT repeat protein